MRRVALVVEDDPDLHMGLSAELKRMGFDVKGALHYEGAVGQLGEGRELHLACIDLALPTRSGYELCEHIRGPLALSRVPILVMSDSALPHDMARAEEAGANAFLKKPFSMQTFSRYIDALLRRARPSEPSLPSMRSYVP